MWESFLKKVIDCLSQVGTNYPLAAMKIFLKHWEPKSPAQDNEDFHLSEIGRMVPECEGESTDLSIDRPLQVILEDKYAFILSQRHILEVK